MGVCSKKHLKSVLKQKFQRGSNRNKAGRNSNLAVKHIFLTGHHFTSAEQRLSGVVTGGGVTGRCPVAFSVSFNIASRNFEISLML